MILPGSEPAFGVVSHVPPAEVVQPLPQPVGGLVRYCLLHLEPETGLLPEPGPLPEMELAELPLPREVRVDRR